MKPKDIGTLPLLTKKTAMPIKEYCIKRKLRCKGCKYETEPDRGSLWTCAFANCPCDWDLD